ncbi:MAG: hypothetical protein IPJ11_15180 [Gemmatimonadetes bacterium]|nr:hypothetical protein [Gemmatimonadota bacterium]
MAAPGRNLLYQARRPAAEGEAAARNGQAFEAQRAWDLAGVKADSAYARAHGVGRGAAEALWVRGRPKRGDPIARPRSRLSIRRRSRCRTHHGVRGRC